MVGLVALATVVKRNRAAPVVVLCADGALRDSLVDLFVADGRRVAAEIVAGSERGAVVVAASDWWPPGWNFARVRSTFRQVPCMVLSGSPLGGHFAVTQLPHGYFVQLPALPSHLLGLVAELSGV